ncbi:hypothetical protein V8C34DRAFT_247933 [Trichoderma compactum]
MLHRPMVTKPAEMVAAAGCRFHVSEHEMFLVQVFSPCRMADRDELLRPIRGAVWHEETERRLRKLDQVYAEGTAPLPHYAPGAESLSEVRTRGAKTAATLSADACILLPQFTAQNCLVADLTWSHSASHCVRSPASSRFYASCMELQVQVITGNGCRREACVEQGRVHGFYNNLFRLPTDAHMPCLAVIRSFGNMPCRYAQALAVHFPLFVCQCKGYARYRRL